MSETFASAEAADSWDEEVVDSWDDVSSVSATLFSLQVLSFRLAAGATTAGFFLWACKAPVALALPPASFVLASAALLTISTGCLGFLLPVFFPLAAFFCTA